MIVKVGEDLDQNGHWQTDHKYARKHTGETEETAEKRRWTIVAISDCSERHESEPEGVDDANKVIVARIIARQPLSIEYE